MKTQLCNHCPAEIPIGFARPGQELECPQCGKKTRVVILPPQTTPAREGRPPVEETPVDPNAGTLNWFWALWILVILGALTMFFVRRWAMDERDVFKINEINNRTVELVGWAIVLTILAGVVTWAWRLCRKKHNGPPL